MTRPNPYYLKRALRMTAREAVWTLACRHEQGDQRNILLFATRRGGSTFVMELIAANRGIRPLDQPLETQAKNLTMAQALEIPRFAQGQITSLDERTGPGLESVVERIFSGEIVINAPTAVWRSDVDRVSNRLVLKLMDCKAIIGWFDDTFAVDTVWLTRNPIPQSLSCIRNGWTLTTNAYLVDTSFVERFVPEPALALAHDVTKSGSELQRFVVNWALENVAAARQIGDRPHWTHVRYEDTVVDPQGTFELLADRLGLHDTERMQAVLTRPSKSSRRSTEQTRSHIEAGRGADAVASWKANVDDADITWARRSLEIFEIDPELVGGW